MSEKGVYQPTTEMDVEDGQEGHGDREAVDRGNWSSKLDFVLSCLSYAVGLGNVWRFPYVCFRNGGGAFLIPFVIMLFITGIPLVFMELSFGQFASQGIVTIWKASPIFQGVGWAMFIVSVLIAIYYNMIIAWTLYYLFASLTSQLPWSFCGPWSGPDCLEDRQRISNCTKHNGAWYNDTCVTNETVTPDLFRQILNMTNRSALSFQSPSDEYFHKEVLQITAGIHEMGGLKWQLALCLLLAWVLVALCLAKGIKTSGKAVYFTAFFPYIVLTILLVRGLTLEGSVNGIIYYLTPEWSRLASAKVWGDAAVQIFFSLSPCWGGLITLSSYNKFNNNCLLDAILVSILDCVTSVFAGLVIFSIIGYMANELGQDVSKVASEGAGLAFVVYPEVVTKLPISQLWAVLFFAMLITLGLGTQIATVTTVHTTLLDRFSTFRHGWGSQILLGIIAVVCYIIGLAFCTQGGMFVLQLFDNYAATYSLLFIGLVECLGLAWVYGADRFLTDIETMLGKRPHMIWSISWKFVAPIALLAILVFTWVDFKPTTYDNFVFPGWADAIGWLISFSSILAIPVVAVYKVVCEVRSKDCSIRQAISNLIKPEPNWGPALAEHRALRMKMDNVNPDAFESQVPLTGFKVNDQGNVNNTQC